MLFSRVVLCLISVVCIAAAAAQPAERDELFWLEAHKKTSARSTGHASNRVKLKIA
jgi:hypothetical protein